MTPNVLVKSATRIAILVPVCSRGQSYVSMDDVPIIRHLIPSLRRTIREEEWCTYEYTLFVGIDDDDVFYRKHLHDLLNWESDIPLRVVVQILGDCSHNPVRAWNKLFDQAYEMGYDYFFQVGDDVALYSDGWTTAFIRTLLHQGNLGTVGPYEPRNYWGRKLQNQNIVNENNFVHRTHYDVFGYFFYPSIRNWHCDDWITFVYGRYAIARMDIQCQNFVQGHRYKIEPCLSVEEYISHGKQILSQYLDRHGISYMDI